MFFILLCIWKSGCLIYSHSISKSRNIEVNRVRINFPFSNHFPTTLHLSSLETTDTIMSSFSCSPHPQRFLLLVLQLDFVTNTGTFIQGHSHPPRFVEWHPKFSDFLSCSPTLSASPKASRVGIAPSPSLISDFLLIL